MGKQCAGTPGTDTALEQCDMAELEEGNKEDWKYETASVRGVIR